MEGGATIGEVYHYAEPFLSQGDEHTPESGTWYARLRHERYLNAQQTVTGRASRLVLAPGEVLEPQGSGLPDSLKNGIVITGIHTSGARDKGFQLRFTGIPYSETVCYRPALLNRPVVAGSLPARVESDEKHDTYAYLDNQGRCGLTQAVSDGTVSATRAIFYKKIKVLHLDFEPRAAANADEGQTPLATMVQVYQLRDRQKVDAADYQKLLRDADTTLKEDIVASKSLLVMPKGSVTLNMPMNEEAKFVAVVGLFNRPDGREEADTSGWRWELHPHRAGANQVRDGGNVHP